MEPEHGIEEAAARLRRRLLWAAGWGFFALGAVGVVVPGLPTVVFWIAAAWLWARSSPRLLHRLVSHPRYGATISDFLNHGVMRRRDKRAAYAGMTLGFVLLVLLLRPGWAIAAGVALGMALGAIWIERRPERVREVTPHASSDT